MTLRARRGGPAGRSFGRIAPVVRCGWRAPANARLALRLEPRLDTKVEAPPADVVIAVEVRPPPGNHVAVGGEGADPRSEEHTSELQSLMRISYAVFCLNKKKNKMN